jgi:hypothetical protein
MKATFLSQTVVLLARASGSLRPVWSNGGQLWAGFCSQSVMPLSGLRRLADRCKRQTTASAIPRIWTGDAGLADWARLEHRCAVIDAVALNRPSWNRTKAPWTQTKK